MAIQINTVYHPDYSSGINEWQKWRLAYEGGAQFIQLYLTKLSNRETESDFTARKNIAYVPKFAAAAIDQIKNAIYQRMSDVVRSGGPTTYQDACKGLLGGVDLKGSMMDTFMGTDVLRELLVMKRVGILLDAPVYQGKTLLDKGDNHPYLTMYCSERIQSWNCVLENNICYLSSVLLSEDTCSENEYGLTDGLITRYRLMQRLPYGQGVKVTFFNPVYDDRTKTTTYQPQESYNLALSEIPFHIACIPVSLMQDVANYQISLMNVESSDIAFLMKANYPFFYEFYDIKAEPPLYKPVGVPGATGESTDNASRPVERQSGASQGRKYPKGVEPPGFTNPNPETLKVSMAKEEQLKEDIFRLVNLNLQNAARSAESKIESQRTLESSLSFLGLILQKAEMCLGKLWAEFEGSDPPTVTYPENYSLRSEAERQTEADTLSKAKNDSSSITYKKAIEKKIVRLRVGPDVSNKEWKTIETEIDSAKCFVTQPADIVAAHEEGLVDDVTAAVGLGFDKSVIEQAKKDRAEKIALTLEAQGGAQNRGASAGAPEFGGASSSQEKDGLPKRGAAKGGGQ